MRSFRTRRAHCGLLAFAAAACVPDVAPVEPLPAGDSGTGGAIGDLPGPDDGAGPPGVGEPGIVSPRDPARDVCDLTGGWLVTEKMVMNALGAKQEVLAWRFLELAQDGEQVVVAKSLICGDIAKGLPPVVITMDSSKVWKSLLTHGTMKGRKATSRASGSGCEITFERAVEVRGATESVYGDLDVPLPSPSEQARDGAPGWEDWDADGKPGISLRVSGTLSGTLHITSRTWTEWAGTADPSAGKFRLGLKWGGDRNPLGVEGSPLLTVQGGSADPDASLHFAEFASVSADALGSTDEARCARVRALAPTLTPGR